MDKGTSAVQLDKPSALEIELNREVESEVLGVWWLLLWILRGNPLVLETFQNI